MANNKFKLTLKNSKRFNLFVTGVSLVISWLFKSYQKLEITYLPSLQQKITQIIDTRTIKINYIPKLTQAIEQIIVIPTTNLSVLLSTLLKLNINISGGKLRMVLKMIAGEFFNTTIHIPPVRMDLSVIVANLKLLLDNDPLILGTVDTYRLLEWDYFTGVVTDVWILSSSTIPQPVGTHGIWLDAGIWVDASIWYD